MKISKIMAVAAATAVAASSVALTAFAAPETVTEKKDVVIANSEFAGKETITITVESETEEANYSNGCVGYNNAAGEWTAVEWTLEEATRFEVTLDVDADIQAGADLQVQCWWFDKNYTVSWVVTEPETTAPETEAPAVTSETENQPGDCAGKPNQTDAPATDAPATDAPATDAPATDAPATDAPVVEYGPEAALDLANKGVSGVDSDGKARLDIINTFVPDEESNILTADALTSAKVNKLTFTFTVSDYTGTAFKAFPIFSFNNWSQAYWGPGDKSNTVDVTPVDVTGNGTYTVELVLPEGVTVEDCQCLALKTDYKVDDTEGAVNPVLSLDSLVANKAADADAPATDAPATDAPATDVPGDSNGANAPTGVGLVVVPAVVAGAVLVATGVVLKKRK